MQRVEGWRACYFEAELVEPLALHDLIERPRAGGREKLLEQALAIGLDARRGFLRPLLKGERTAQPFLEIPFELLLVVRLEGRLDGGIELALVAHRDEHGKFLAVRLLGNSNMRHPSKPSPVPKRENCKTICAGLAKAQAARKKLVRSRINGQSFPAFAEGRAGTREAPYCLSPRLPL